MRKRELINKLKIKREEKKESIQSFNKDERNRKHNKIYK